MQLAIVCLRAFSSLKNTYSAEKICFCKICPRVEPDHFDADAALEVLDSSLTPSALKKLSKSVMDLSTMSEMKELSKSTSNLMTGGITLPKFKMKKRLKSESKTSLVRGSDESLATIDVNRAFYDLAVLGVGIFDIEFLLYDDFLC